MTLLALAVVLWLVGFDIIYALQDYEFDKSHGLHSLVVAWGPKNALAAAFLAHMVMCGLLLAFGLLCRFPHRVRRRLVHHRRLPRAGTLDCSPPQPELDQPRVLPAQRARQRGISHRHRRRGDFSGRIYCGEIGETCNAQHWSKWNIHWLSPLRLASLMLNLTFSIFPVTSRRFCF